MYDLIHLNKIKNKALVIFYIIKVVSVHVQKNLVMGKKLSILQ